jgi:cyclic pyranopterin phosphate synthase
MTTVTNDIRDKFRRGIRDLRLSVIDRCKFRCAYCMPKDKFPEDYRFLPRKDWLGFAEITRLTRLFQRLGATKVRLTGGEPLLRPQLPELVESLAHLDGIEDLALTTNGALLERLAAPLAAAGLHRVNVSIDSLDDEVFGIMSGGRQARRQTLAGIAAAREAGLPVKLNVVVIKDVNDHTLIPLLEHFRGSGIIVRFIEYMDVGNLNGWEMAQVLPAKELLARIADRWPLEALDSNYHGEVAKRYAFTDGGGEIGFITSVTDPFCGSCERARLSADGKLFTCLFASDGLDLRTPLREGASDDELADIIATRWRRREDRYSEQRVPLTEIGKRKKVEMYHIGG